MADGEQLYAYISNLTDDNVTLHRKGILGEVHTVFKVEQLSNTRSGKEVQHT